MSLLGNVRCVASRLRSAIVVPSVFAFLTLTSGPARAQTPMVTGIVPPVSRIDPSGAPANPHPASVADNVINYADCEADLSYVFTMQLSGATTQNNLVVWVGPNDCTALTSREGPMATCWPLAAGPLSWGNGGDDAGTTTTFKVRVQDIVSQASGPIATSGGITTTYPPGGWTDQANGVCTKQLTDAQVPLFLWVFFTDHDNLGEGGVGGGDGIGVGQAYPLTVDTYAQDLNGNVTIDQSLDSQLIVNITAPTDTDTLSYNIYCDPAPGAKQPPYDAAVCTVVTDAAPKNQCLVDAADAADAPPDDATANAPDSDPFDSSVDSSGGLFTDASVDAPKGAPEDSSVGDSSSEDAAITPPPPDDAGGNACGISTNDAAITLCSTGGCPSSYLQSGAGTASAGSAEDGGVDEAGDFITTVVVDAGASKRGTMLLSIPPKYLCGTASPSSPQFTITGLTDGYNYTIAVAAVDVSGNVGPLAVGTGTGEAGTSNCKTVSEIPDFWTNYVQAGGQAGGGYCSTEGVGVPAGTTGLGLLMIASMVAITRARRQRRR